MQRSDSKEARSAHNAPGRADPEIPRLQMAQMPLVRLQSMIGNQNVQRMLSKGVIEKLTGDLISDLVKPPAPQKADEHSGGLLGGIITSVLNQQSRFAGDQEFHAKALPKNQYYASNPPSPGWPYTDQLRALWESGQFSKFADEVASYQHFTLKLPEAQVDGILGPRTSRRLRESQGGAQTPAPSSETGTPAPAEDTRTTTAFPAPDDSAVSGHPAATRILNPVKQAFAEYKAAEKQYQAADRAVSKAKKDEKAAKEEERQKEMGEMEESRAAARTIMDAARDQVAALTVSEFTSPAEMKQVIGYINRQLNTHTIYYTQMSNANILSGNGLTAAWRTCNMTVMAMMLEALGKSSKDYTGDLTKLQSLAGDYDEALGKNNSKPEDLTSLRLPDFLQLVAIDLAGSRDKAAGKITSHAFITDVARSFGLKVVDIKGNERLNHKGEHEKSFLGNKYSGNLNSIGVLYRPATSDALKELAKDEEYKKLKGADQKAYAEQHIEKTTENRRLKFIQNTEDWKDIDTQAKTQLEALQAEFGKPNATDTAKPRFFDAEFQAKADETIKGLQDIATAVPKEHKGRKDQIDAIAATLNKAIKADRKKPDAPPKNLTALFDGKGKDDPIKQLENNFKKYESIKTLYETLGEEGGAEELVPLDDYKATVIPTMQQAIESGFQVMVNLDNHFVRLQSVADDGFVIDDPGKTSGEDNKISWEQGRKYGYFQHYLLISQ
jgi:hypothetical protein